MIAVHRRTAAFAAGRAGRQPFDSDRADVILAEALVKGTQPVTAANLVRAADGKYDVAIASLVGQSARPEPPARHLIGSGARFSTGALQDSPPATPEADHNLMAERTAETDAGPRETQIRDSIQQKVRQHQPQTGPERSVQEPQRERVALRDLQPARTFETTPPTAAPKGARAPATTGPKR
jgi:hypothetical protein